MVMGEGPTEAGRLFAIPKVAQKHLPRLTQLQNQPPFFSLPLPSLPISRSQNGMFKMSVIRRSFRTVGLPVVALVVCASVLLITQFGDGGVPEIPGRRATDSLHPVEIVVASMKHEDTSWVQQHLPDWSHSIFIVDDSSAKLTVPKNKGREAMVYLT